MPISFECEHCGRPTRVADDLAGRRIRCPGCREVTTVPEEIVEIADEEVQVVAERPTRKIRRTFEEEATRKKLPERPTRSLTLSNEAQASNPGGINVNFLKYWSSFPTWPTIWFVSTAVFLVFTIFAKAMVAMAALCGTLLVLYWIRVREHFKNGCALPGIVVSVDQQLVAFCTDLSTGEGEYPAVRILQQPLHKMTGGPPKKNQRVVGVAIYEQSPTQNDHWETFHPKVANCVTYDEQAIQQTFDSIDEDDWQELISYLQRMPQKTIGLHKFWR